jgi:hypothetical protein
MRLHWTLAVVVLLLACHAAAGISHTRDLLQKSNQRSRRAAPQPVSSARNRDGVFFDFTPFGGAAAFLAKQEPGLIPKLTS